MCNITCHGYIATYLLTIVLLRILCCKNEHHTGYLTIYLFLLNEQHLYHLASQSSKWSRFSPSGHNSHLCPILIIPNTSYSKGVIKSIVTRPCSHAVPPNLPLSDWCCSTHCKSASHAVILLPPPAGLPTSIHYPKMSTYLCLAISFTTTLKCHSLPTTPPGLSLIQPYSPSCSSSSTFTLSIQHPAPHPLQTPASVRPSAAVLCGGSCGECLPHMRGLLTLAVRLGRCYD